MYTLLLVPLLALMFIPVFAEESNEECIFTSHLEKSFVYFKDRPWVMGYVNNCNGDIDLYKKDFVYIRILDVNGDVVDDKWKKADKTSKNLNPQKYVFNDSVYRGGGLGGNADVSGKDVIHIRENHYFFYMPQIHAIDFDHMGYTSLR